MPRRPRREQTAASRGNLLPRAQAATRGDGAVGEDVGHAVPHIAGVPAAVGKSARARHFSVRGEVYISTADFAALNARRQAAGEAPFATARNAAAGSLRVLHSSIADRGLRFAAFELIPTPSDFVPDSAGKQRAAPKILDQWEALHELEALGFATVLPHSATSATVEDAITHGEALLQRRGDMPFETDGCVVKVRSIAVRRRRRGRMCWPAPAHSVHNDVAEIPDGREALC